MKAIRDFKVGGIKCSGCEETLRQGLLDLPVFRTRTDRISKLVMVEFDF